MHTKDYAADTNHRQMIVQPDALLSGEVEHVAGVLLGIVGDCGDDGGVKLWIN